MTSQLLFDIEVTSSETGKRVVTQHTSGPHSFDTPLEAARFAALEKYRLPSIEGGYGKTTSHRVVDVRMA